MKSVLTVGLLAAACLAQAQTTPVTCNAGTLSGIRSLVLNGRDAGSNPSITKVLEAVGTATFDGVSAVTLSLNTNTNQTSGVTQTWSGTYSLPSNCLGTMTITTGDAATFTLIPYNGGHAFTITGQDATYSLTGTGTTPPTACITPSLSGAYGFTGNGFILASGAVNGVNAISGILQFDGAGAVTGSWTVSTAGSTAAASVTGKYTVSSSCTGTASVTDANGGTYTLGFTVTSADSSNVGISLSSSTATFTANGHSTFTYPGLAVEQAAGVSLATPPGSVFSIYGFNLSTGQAPATGFPLPLTLASASVTVNNEAVPLYFVDNKALGTEGLINAIMPYDIPPGVVPLVVKNGSTVSNAVAITIPATPVPAVFTYGTNHAAAQILPNYTLNSTNTPAAVGDEVVVYFTGGGPVQNQSQLAANQAIPSALFPVTSTMSATVAGASANVRYMGLAPTEVFGVYQANIVIPKVAAGERNLQITIGGKASNVTTLSIK